jgi:hypothetical protein
MATRLPRPEQQFLTTDAARSMAGLPDRRRFLKLIEPAAWLLSAKGELRPLFLRSDVEALAAQERGDAA